MATRNAPRLPVVPPEDLRAVPPLGMDPASIRRDFLQNLFTRQAKFAEVATRNDHYLALAGTVRDRLLQRWIESSRTFRTRESRTVVYLSAEYLMGPQLEHNLLCLGMREAAAEALQPLGIDLELLIDHEEEPGLGNGGLGRLAACYMDSLATLGMPAIGYGIRYEYGIFDQRIVDGWQVEATDTWLQLGNPWEIPRYQIEHIVGFGGRVESGRDEAGHYWTKWTPERRVRGVAHDTPVLGFGTDNANFLRLWTALAVEEFDFQAFNTGDYVGAVHEKVGCENLTKVLYPNDDSLAGKQLRLEQQYLFVTCSLQDMIRIYKQRNSDLHGLSRKYAVQLNDTHPALAITELMRLLVDENAMPWDEAWQVTTDTCAYTNHTLLPEALETWPLPLMQRLLPRHVQILFEINRRFLDEVRERRPGDEALVQRVSLIDEGGDKRVRMAHLAVVGSHKVNGVAALHSQLLRQTVLRDFADLYPDRFTNVTNGVTPRRFVRQANPSLSKLITEAIGPGWETDLERLRGLEPLADDAAFRHQWRAIKRANKVRLNDYLQSHVALSFDPDALLDCQTKRIHEYKRQHLNLLRTIVAFDRLRQGLDQDLPTRTVLLGGKAAPGYRTAKLIIRLAHGIAEAIAQEPLARDRLRVVFVPDFNVKIGQVLYPAADLSEQISTAGKEASGTGNMKFALNGALTIGTLDGANVEIRELVGADHFFLFGLTAAEVVARKAAGYQPWEVVAQDHELRGALELLAGGAFSRGDPDMFAPLVRNLLDRDDFLVLADFAAYRRAQAEVEARWVDPEAWTRSSILNTARSGWFSSDRSMRDYAERIWDVRAERVSIR
jgi:starch phosphorylase